MRALALIVLLLAAGQAVAVPTPEATTKKALGDSRRDAGDSAGALAAYREAVQISGDFIEVWEEIGKLYFEAKKWGDAAGAFQRAVEIDGTYANNWFNLALASRRANDLARSRDAFRRYLVLKPEDTEARLRLGDLLRQLGEREAAIKEYQAVLSAAEARTVAPALGEKAKDAIAQLSPATAATPPAVVPATTAPPVATAAPAGVAPKAEGAPATQATPAQATQQPSVAAPAPSAAPPGAAAVGVKPPASVAAPPAPAPTPRPVVEPVAPPSPALLDKLALGDKLQAASDYRGALFAYQDAVYLDPRHVVARVKLGRAYWVLRYVGQADEQWLQANQLAPNDPSIAHMIDEARKAPRPAIAGSAEPSNGAPAGASAATGGTSQGTGAGAATGPAGAGEVGGAPRVYKFVPESTHAQPQQQPQPQYAQPQYAQPQQQPQYAPPQYAQPQYAQPQQLQQQYAQQPPQQYAQPQYAPAQPQYAPQQYSQPQYATAQPQYAQPVAPIYAAPLQAAPAPTVSAAATAAAQRYRTALSLYTQRDYLGAIAELDAAITLDPNLAVAFVARGSAKFGMANYRGAAADYKAALDLDTARAEPIWGLAECQRMLRDPAAPDTYRRYAASVAGDVNEDRRARARRWATELSPPQPVR